MLLYPKLSPPLKVSQWVGLNPVIKKKQLAFVVPLSALRVMPERILPSCVTFTAYGDILNSTKMDVYPEKDVYPEQDVLFQN